MCLLSLPCVADLLTRVSAFLIVCAFCRSLSHPPTQEVLWALGAGCRNINTLHVAPSYPWPVHTPQYIILNLHAVGLFRKNLTTSSLLPVSISNLQPANHHLRRPLSADDWSMLATAALAQCWRSRLWDSGIASARSVTVENKEKLIHN